MKSVFSTVDRPPEDLTGRARIRDAAMAQFAERGYRAATMKSIADAAGVSVGLVQHHFGTKEELRRACDAAAVEIVRRQMRTIEHIGSDVAAPDFGARLYDKSPVLVRYLIRLFVEGSPEAAPLFDEMAGGTAHFLSDLRPDLFPADSDKARNAATLMAVMHLGPAVLHEQVSRRVGVDLFDPATAPRLGLLILDIYAAMGDWVTSETGVKARSAVAAYLDSLSPSHGEPDQEHDDE